MAGLPIKTHLDYKYGDSYSGVEVIWEDVNGVAIDLTGFVASMQVRDSDGVMVLYLDSNVSDSDSDPDEGGLTLEEGEGKVILNAKAGKMTGGGLMPGEIYDYDIQVKSADGNTVRTLMFGKFSVHAQVTDV